MTGWRKSSRSIGNGACAEVRAGPAVQVRDSTDPGGTVLTFSPEAWRRFTREVRGAGPCRPSQAPVRVESGS